LRYHRWAEKGWTSEMVDNERAVLMDAYDVIDAAIADARERAAAHQAARERAGRHLRG